ncbi:MAG: glycosyltransferase family 25 protein [Aquabacterium sp.]
MKVFVISLSRSQCRRMAIAQHLGSLGIDFEFFDAVDGRALGREPALSRGARWPLTAGEIGCYLSHVGVWLRVIDEEIPKALVLEDDAVLTPDAWPVIERCANLGGDWDVIRLSAIEKQVGWPLIDLDARHAVALATKSPSGTAGYVLSLLGAQRLMASLREPVTPIDTAFDEYWAHGLRILMTVPPVVLHGGEGVQSTIDRTGCDRSDQLGIVSRLRWSAVRKVRVFMMLTRYLVRPLRLPEAEE